jgi:hypothetical protein
MHSGYPSDGSSGESERPSPTAAEGFTITPQDASILKGYLEDFQKADTETRKKILEKAVGEIYALHPLDSAFDKKVAKKVLAPKSNKIVLLTDSCTTENQNMVLQPL